MKQTTKRGGLVVVAIGVLVALAACGSSKPTVASSAQPHATTSTMVSPTAKAAATAPAVKTASTTNLGTVLVDSRGMTLYTLTKNGKPVACTGQCATFWPPLLLPADTMTAMGGMGVTGLGTASTTAGLQVTANGLPVYRFSIDKTPGDANGDGIASFGGVWHVAKLGGNPAAMTSAAPASVVTSPPTAAHTRYPPPPATSPPATSPPTTAYSYGGGYGYGG